jgi:hypothetical protein
MRAVYPLLLDETGFAREVNGGVENFISGK